MKRGGPLKRTALKRKTPLKAMSAKRKASLSKRRRTVQEVIERDKFCQARDLVPDVACGGPLTGHEPLFRSRGGDPTDPEQVIACCWIHNGWIADHPKEAEAVGLAISRYA